METARRWILETSLVQIICLKQARRHQTAITINVDFLPVLDYLTARDCLHNVLDLKGFRMFILISFLYGVDCLSFYQTSIDCVKNLFNKVIIKIT